MQLHKNDSRSDSHRGQHLGILLALAIAVLVAHPGFAGGGVGHNKELFVVPAPGKVAIDGSLEDWDVSGRIPYYVAPATRDTRSAEVAMMYDTEALYVGGKVRDSSPMMNRHDPRTKPSRAWDADVCQIFFSLDPDDKQPLPYGRKKEHKHVSPVATMMLWYFTDRKEPSLAMYRGMGFTKAVHPEWHENGHIPSEHFEAAYKKGEDGLSYTFEYRIPWTTLAVKRAPQAKDTLAAAMAVFWSRPDGLKTGGGNAWAWNVMAKPGFPYQSAACWGALQFTAQNNIPREWVEADLPPEQPLPLSFQYDLPREGECTIQLFDQENRSVRILVAQQRRPQGVNNERWDGLDKNDQALPAGTYTWRGVVHDPIKMEYRLSVHNSGNPPYPTDDNTGGWGGDHGEPSTVCAFAKGLILAWDTCEYGWGLIRVDLDGQKQWGSKRTARFLATDGKRVFTAGGHGWSNAGGVSVIDIADSRPLNFQPGMEALPPPEGEGKAAVTGLACDGKRIYVSYGGRNVIGVYDLKGNLTAQWKVPAPGRLDVGPDGALVAFSGKRIVSVKDGAVSDLVTEELAAPRGIAVSAAGEVFVALAGERQQVQVFDANGTPVRTIGKAGGRPAKGKYDPAGMYEPGGMDIDPRGRLWVAETKDGPKRISVWDTKTGENVDEYFGSSGYFAYGNIDPARPDEIYAHHVLWKIDWKKYKGYPLTTIWRKTAPDMVSPPNPSAYRGHPKLFTAKNGRQYMFGSNKVLRRDGDLFKPFLMLYNRYPAHVLGEDKKKHRNEAYLWQDRNDDQCVQAEEVVLLPARMRKVGLTVDPELHVYLSSGHALRPETVTDVGQPIYDVQKLEQVPVGKAPHTDGFVYSYPGGSLHREGKYESDPRGTFAKRTQEGEFVWKYTGIPHWKRSLGLPTVGPGRIWGMTGLMGVAGDSIAIMSYFGVNHLFNRDGVYVAALLKDGRTRKGRGAYEGQPEGQNGSFVKLSIDGKDRFFLIHGGQDTRVWEVLGLESVQKLPGGTYEHTPEMVAAARKALEAWEAAKQGHAPLAIVRGREALAKANPAGKKLEDSRAFAVHAAYDEKNLYLKYDVTAPHPLLNTTPEERILFRGGNCLDLQIATDPKANPERATPAPGDVRVLITRRDGKPFAMVYRPKVKGFKGKPIVLRSPTGTESFDAIETTDRVGLDYEQTDTGFTAVATIPLDVLGWTPKAGKDVRMDVGYIFGNAKGTRTSARAYWANNSFSANVVDDIPNESRLEPDEWGTAAVK